MSRYKFGWENPDKNPVDRWAEYKRRSDESIRWETWAYAWYMLPIIGWPFMAYCMHRAGKAIE